MYKVTEIHLRSVKELFSGALWHSFLWYWFVMCPNLKQTTWLTEITFSIKMHINKGTLVMTVC